MHNVYPLLMSTNFPSIYRDKLKIAQINLGYTCNQSCLHCHVNASPKRTEQMSLEVMRLTLNFIDINEIKIVDLTGGAPELNKNFKFFVKELSSRGCHIIDRCNLTIIFEKDQEKLAEFLKNNEIEIIASLPCYLEENVNRQRGNDVFEKSIKALKIFNKLGYGIANNLPLHLVYNPQGPTLPPDQKTLQNKYKEYLKNKYHIVFNKLFVITNMPIARFGSTLITKNQFNTYMNLLKDSFCKETLPNLMCKSLVSIDYLGNLYDCDFNQMLKIHMGDGIIKNVRDLSKIPEGQKIAIADHCYGCTAGNGSSCGGNLI